MPRRDPPAFALATDGTLLVNATLVGQKAGGAIFQGVVVPARLRRRVLARLANGADEAAALISRELRQRR